MSTNSDIVSATQKREIETAIAELSIKQSKEFNILPILPVAEEIIPTYFWVDKFDIKVEWLCGSGVVNTTHLMAFQEPSIGVTQANFHTPVTTLVRTDRRKISLNQDEKVRTTHKIDPNAEPPKFNTVMSPFGTEFSYPINQFYFLWLFLRWQSHVDQIVPTFSDWQLQNRQREIPTYQLKNRGNVSSSNTK